MRSLIEGTRLADRYVLIRRLGAGGMSAVWLADDLRAGSRIALKFQPTGNGADARQRDNLKREWQIGSRLMHPNIIRVFEFHDDPDGAYFGLQYVGDTNIGVLAGKPPRESMRPLAMIADALRYAHGKDIVHRDIKAANVLLDSRGLPYLVDFGVASRPGDLAMSGSGSAIAMSPQQLSGDPAQPADDLFALGVLMHELLTGVPPGGPERHTIADALADRTPMPPALGSLLADLLAQDAGSRPDAESVAARLAAAGYPPGPAPTRYVSGQAAANEVFDSVEPLRTYRKADSPSLEVRAPRGEASGISPRILYGGLSAALLVFLAVIFVLPKLVGPDVATSTSVAPSSAPAATGDLPTNAGPESSAGEPATTAGSDASFNENLANAAGIKTATDEALGDLLSRLERLRYRGVERWGGQPYLDAVNVYAEGDQAYVDKNYRLAGEKYRQASRMLDPFFDRIESVFEETLAAAKAAFAAEDAAEAVRLFDLAVAITPGNREAEAGLARAKSLDAVLSLMAQGLRYEEDLELDAARTAFQKALELDALWQPAADALARVNAAIKDLSFQQRMTEGFEALGVGDFDTARAAFNAAKLLNPGSREPADGLLQLDQEMRLAEIQRLEGVAEAHDRAEEWETAVTIYEEILKIDPDLQFAKEGLSYARGRAALHAQLQAYIDDPDHLSDDANMQAATRLLLDVARVQPMGPRLEDQKNELSRLLKRAATPLTVELVSDNQTIVSIYKVGQFGTFANRELELRPGNYVAVGYREGYRDVRVEFRVAPEIDMRPVVVRCEEQI